ncbi:MAG TPA: hypothetical protein VGG03_10235 [Thermoanaerobaculia bacterium]|jgi:hypothetical protein
MATVEMVPKHALSFREFVRLSEHQRRALGQVAIIPPQLGTPGFGCVITEKPVFVQRASKALRVVKKRKRNSKRPKR